MANPKITIIVPTRERPDVLPACLKTVTEQDYDNFEIIVSDNFSGDETEEIVRNTDDPRVTYINPGRRLSMSHHWEFALSHVKEGWVSFIGDDDGLLQHALNRVASAVTDTKVQAIRSSICNYWWPGIAREGHGRLSIPLRTGVEIRNSRQWIDRLLEGRASYTDLPAIYQSGFIHSDVIEKIKQKSDVFFRSCNPDVYSGLAIAGIIPSYAYLREPLAINGASRHSNGRSFLKSPRSDSSSAYAKFISEGNIAFHPEVPLLHEGEHPKSISILVYEAYLQSELLHTIPVERMHAQQLGLALATSHAQEQIEQWGRLFARHHSLDFESLLSRSKRARIKFNLRNKLKLAHEEISTARIGSPDLPLLNVYQASLVADDVLGKKPSRLENIGRITNHFARKYARSSSLPPKHTPI